LIRKYKFLKLNIKQQIYKLAHAIRKCEQDLKSSLPLDTTEIEAYLNLISKCQPHPKLQTASDRAKTLLSELPNISGVRSQTSRLNFCYHDLLQLVGEPIGEKFFSVHRFDSEKPSQRFPVVAILDNIRSPFNVGSIFRSSDCFGISELALCGITLTPDSLKIQRTAMGTTEQVEWKYFERTAKAIKHYRELGYQILALETTSEAIDLAEIRDFSHTAFVFGNEEFGIPEEHLALCDQVIQIPLVGIKNSLNVANSFAVVGYQILHYFLSTTSKV